MIPAGLEVEQFAQIRLTLEAKVGDNSYLEYFLFYLLVNTFFYIQFSPT